MPEGNKSCIMHVCETVRGRSSSFRAHFNPVQGRQHFFCHGAFPARAPKNVLLPLICCTNTIFYTFLPKICIDRVESLFFHGPKSADPSRYGNLCPFHVYTSQHLDEMWKMQVWHEHLFTASEAKQRTSWRKQTPTLCKLISCCVFSPHPLKFKDSRVRSKVKKKIHQFTPSRACYGGFCGGGVLLIALEKPK